MKFFGIISEKIKKTPLSAWVFRGLLALLLIIATVASFVIYDVLSDYLMGYEIARPEYVANSYFQRLFSGEDYSFLYSELEIDPNGPVSEKEFSLWIKNRIGEGTLSYKEAFSGLSDDSKYYIYLDDEKIGEFVLSPSGEKNEEGFDIYKESEISIQWTPESAYIIRVQKGSEVRVNGSILGKEYITDTGSLINGEYEIYTVNGLYNAPEISARLDGKDCYITKTLTEKVYTDEVFENVGNVESTTVRVIKGHKVYADGELIGDDNLVKGADGYIEGYYKGDNKLWYVVYSVPKNVDELKVVDESGNEVAYRKIEGTRIYSEAALDLSGTLEFLALTSSEVYLSGVKLGKEYISVADIKTKSCEYMPEGVNGSLYNKYSVHWVGEEPSIKAVNLYGTESIFEAIRDFGNFEDFNESKVLLTESPYSEELKTLFSNELLTISKKYSKMMIRYTEKSDVLSHFEKGSVGYKQINQIVTAFLSKPHSYKIYNENTMDFCKYGDNVYSGTVCYEVETKTRATVTKFNFNYTFYFKYEEGRIIVFNMANNG